MGSCRRRRCCGRARSHGRRQERAGIACPAHPRRRPALVARRRKCGHQVAEGYLERVERRTRRRRPRVEVEGFTPASSLFVHPSTLSAHAARQCSFLYFNCLQHTPHPSTPLLVALPLLVSLSTAPTRTHPQSTRQTRPFALYGSHCVPYTASRVPNYSAAA